MYKKIVFIGLFSVLFLRAAERDFALEQFKQLYVDTYHDDVKDYRASSYLKYAPADLKQWFQDIKDNKDSNPALLYGLPGVGKSLTSQALVRDAGATLCYIPYPDQMKIDNDYWFDQECLERLDGKVCVVVDGINDVNSQLAKTLGSIIDKSVDGNELHFLAIANHAYKKMPATLYCRVKPIAFPVPDSGARLEILKQSLARRHLFTATEVNDDYLQGVADQLYMPANIVQFCETLSFKDSLNSENQSQGTLRGVKSLFSKSKKKSSSAQSQHVFYQLKKSDFDKSLDSHKQLPLQGVSVQEYK